MKTSSKGLKLIAQREGVILHVYKDSKGLPTFGCGHLVKPGEHAEFPVGKKITQAVSDKYLAQDLKECEDAVNALGVKLGQNRFDACVSLAFNIGVPGFKSSSCARNIRSNNMDAAAHAILLWNKPPQIKGRRHAEYVQFLTPYKFAEGSPIILPLKSDEPKPPADTPDTGPPVKPLDSEPPVPTPDPQAVAVQTVSAAPESKIDATLNRWSARFVAIPATALTFLGAFGAWLKDSPTNLVIALIIVAGVISTIYFVLHMIFKARAEARAHEMTLSREKDAHEVQIALIAAASSPQRNTVSLIDPPPSVALPNSDAPADNQEATP